MRMRRLRSFTEACIFGGCLMLLLFSMAQVLLLSSRSRPSHAGTVTDTKRSKTTAHVEPQQQQQQQQQPDIGVIRQRDVLKRALASPANAAAKAKFKARTKAQQEVRELERSLVKLMRQNSRTPEQSRAELETELYGMRVGRIIQQVAQEAIKRASSVLAVSAGQGELQASSLFQSRSAPNSRNLDMVSSQRQAFSDVSQSEHRNSSYRAHIPRFLSGDNLLVPSDIDSASLKLKKSPFSRKGDESHLAHRAQHNSRTIDPTEMVREVGRIDDTEKGRIMSDFVSSNNLSDVKMDSSLSKYSFAKSEHHRKLGGIQPHTKVLCPIEPDNLVGNGTDVNLTQPLDIDDIMAEHADVLDGGEWAPSDCVSRHRVAFVIPYRDRWGHLKSLLYYLIPVLKRQQIHFRMFVVEQFGNDTFNKGRIMNAAFREALKLFDFQCVTFHDVDLVPEDDRNMYSCADMPKHMSIGIDKFNYHLPYDGLVGGVLMFRTEHFQQVNGYSNMYWGWGAEDDDMTTRILHQGLRIYRPPSNIARYKMVKHDGRKVSEVSVRMKLLRSAARRSKMEGLNNIQYTLLYTHTEKLFTHFLVDIGHP
ncbi:hypothetical protein RRG08_023234 [Elysia crispata]|uniref:Beta-1,4-N-acetylgalactosaminyltransferase bre-4 n=1 Tax=Elysia crispata TaxID=231223 RepID=A0AAE1DJT7_9GAST|nr:hypothetical protein RRG08_023234 [Elysia crispata]